MAIMTNAVCEPHSGVEKSNLIEGRYGKPGNPLKKKSGNMEGVSLTPSKVLC